MLSVAKVDSKLFIANQTLKPIYLEVYKLVCKLHSTGVCLNQILTGGPATDRTIKYLKLNFYLPFYLFPEQPEKVYTIKYAYFIVRIIYSFLQKHIHYLPIYIRIISLELWSYHVCTAAMEVILKDTGKIDS